MTIFWTFKTLEHKIKVRKSSKFAILSILGLFRVKYQPNHSKMAINMVWDPSKCIWHKKVNKSQNKPISLLWVCESARREPNSQTQSQELFLQLIFLIDKCISGGQMSFIMNVCSLYNNSSTKNKVLQLKSDNDFCLWVCVMLGAGANSQNQRQELFLHLIFSAILHEKHIYWVWDS